MTGLRVRHSLCRRKMRLPPALKDSELEQIVTRLESGDLPLEEALNEFERGVQLARQGQAKLQQADGAQLSADNEDAS